MDFKIYIVILFVVIVSFLLIVGILCAVIAGARADDKMKRIVDEEDK